MKLTRLLFVLLLLVVVVLVLSDDARRAVARPLGRFREHFYRLGRPPLQVPMAVTKIANDKDVTLEKATEDFQAMLATAERLRFEGSVTEQLPSGHVLVVGQLRRATGGAVSPQQSAFALFGYPSSRQLAPGALVRCDVQGSGIHQFARAAGQLVHLEELIYAGEITPGSTERSHTRTLLDR